MKSLVVTVVLLAFQIALMPPMAKAADRRELERKIEDLEAANRILGDKTAAMEDQLRQQTEEVNRLKQEVMSTAQPAQAMQQKVDARLVALEKRHSLQVGFLAGYAESPYDMPGGFFFGAYVPHTLLTMEEDGVPFGDVTGELMAGVVLGKKAVTKGNLATLAGLAPAVPTFMDTIEIQPTAQYRLNLDAIGLKSIDFIQPYVLVGPGIWISLQSTPVVNPSSIPGERFRHEDADLQAGGVYGAGFQLSLRGLGVPLIQGILNRTAVGVEWRYNALANGEQFQQYTGSITLGM